MECELAPKVLVERDFVEEEARGSETEDVCETVVSIGGEQGKRSRRSWGRTWDVEKRKERVGEDFIRDVFQGHGCEHTACQTRDLRRPKYVGYLLT